MSEERIEPSKNLRAQVAHFYGLGCAICGPNVPLAGIQLHHLDDDPSHTTFPNLVPVCGTENSAIEVAKRKGADGFNSTVHPNYLQQQGRELYSRGDYARAYACNRIAAYIFERQNGDGDRATQSLVHCLSALRPLGEDSLLVDTAKQFVRLARGQRLVVQPFWCAEFLEVFGHVLYDYGEPLLALVFYDRAEAFYDHVSGTDSKRESDVRLARALKRGVLAASAAIGAPAQLVDLMKVATEVPRRTKDYEALGSAMFIEASLREMRDQKTKARDLVEEAMTWSRKNDRWSQAQLLELHGRLCLEDGNKKSAIDSFSESAGLFSAHRIKPLPLPAPFKLRNTDPRDLLAGLGRPQVPTIGIRAGSPFSDALLRRILDAVGSPLGKRSSGLLRGWR